LGEFSPLGAPKKQKGPVRILQREKKNSRKMAQSHHTIFLGKNLFFFCNFLKKWLLFWEKHCCQTFKTTPKKK
jgi:hypothetical protein